ncbi:MAG: penicillin-binding protein activator LpoB, partial [Bacteroidales bacterium]|nr:penicillin-binding protein activator LpoB [Bacteroidales bacterium]
MKKTLTVMALCMTLGVAFSSCRHRVERVDVDEQIDLSGRWNDTDSRLVAEEMVNQVLDGEWIANHQRAHQGKKPVVIVGLVYNNTTEHIDANTFIKDVEKAFIKSGRVRLVQAGEKREELRKERAAQQDFASSETAKKWGRELGADYMLQGDISSIVDQYKKEKVVYYQTSLELSDLESNEVVWIGDK